MEIRGQAPSLDTALAAFTPMATGLSQLLAFAANAPVGVIEPHLAFDATPGQREHEFLEVFLPDESGLPTQGRLVDVPTFDALIGALPKHADWARINRAIVQYGLALGYWFLGGETLALAHLYMAAEALTTAVVRKNAGDRPLEELAAALGIDVTKKGWQYAVDGWYRATVIFQGDRDTYQQAREASDGLEHGYMELGDVHRRALAVTEKSFSYVRQAIADLLDLPAAQRATLLEKAPLDVRSLRRIMRGTFVGDAEHLAAPGEMYPLLRWESAVERIERDDDGQMHAKVREHVTVVCAEGVEYRPTAFEVRGRQATGEEPIEITESDIELNEQ